MLTKIGIGSLLAGLFIGVLAGISGFMAKKTMWSDLTISKMLGEDKTEAIITFTDIAAVQNGLDTFMYEIPFFGVCIGFGVLFLILGMFFKNY